jgi:hypothetical protein
MQGTGYQNIGACRSCHRFQDIRKVRIERDEPSAFQYFDDALALNETNTGNYFFKVGA